MSNLLGQLKDAVPRGVLTRVSPRHRRWQHLLDSLTLDPATLPTPLEPTGDRDVIVCGAPRTGTSLVSAVLHAPPRSIAVMEPWDGLRLPPARLFGSIRGEIRTTGGLSRGRLDVAAQASDGEVRWMREGSRWTPIVADDDAVLAVKWPAFWRYLPLLPDTRFVVCLREPAEVISSFERVGGRLASGFDYDVPFNREMNAHLAGSTSDPRSRRLEMFDHIHERIIPFLDRPNVLAVRYERWFEDRPAVLAAISDFIGEDVTATPVRLRRGTVPGADEVAAMRAASRTAVALGYPSEGRA